jgi:hypothetical protein
MIRLMTIPTLFIQHLASGVIYHTDRAEENCGFMATTIGIR